MKARTYQQEAVNSVLQDFRDEYQSVLVVMATGTGKSFVLAELASLAQKGRVLVIAHREEIIHQLAKMLRVVSDKEVGIEMADWRAQTRWNRPQIVVATIQTLMANGCYRLEELVDDPGEWSMTIVDEAHHSSAESYVRLIEHMQQNDSHRVLGVTATPDRMDRDKGGSLGRVFDKVSFEYGIDRAIADGWLVPVVQRTVYVESLDYSNVRTTAGELNGKDLSRILERERVLQSMVSPTMEIAGDRPTVFYAASVAQAEAVCDIMNRHRGHCARFVSGETPKPERRKIFDDFASGEFQFLVNCMIATEGWDCPTVELIVVGRPTKSRALWTQIVGRGLRPLPGIVDNSPSMIDSPEQRRAAIAACPKPRCEVLDFHGNSGRHKLITTMDILGGTFPEPVRERAVELMKESDEPVDPDELLEEAAEQLRREEEERRDRERARRAEIIAKANFSTKTFDPFNAMDITRPIKLESDPPATDEQILFIARISKGKINAVDWSSKQAQTIIRDFHRRKKLGLCSILQAKVLSDRGFDPNMSREAANKTINMLAQGGWK